MDPGSSPLGSALQPARLHAARMAGGAGTAGGLGKRAACQIGFTMSLRNQFAEICTCQPFVRDCSSPSRTRWPFDRHRLARKCCPTEPRRRHGGLSPTPAPMQQQLQRLQRRQLQQQRQSLAQTCPMLLSTRLQQQP